MQHAERQRDLYAKHRREGHAEACPYIGPDQAGRMLEVITVDDIDNGEVAIHAMKLRNAYERHLPEEDRP